MATDAPSDTVVETVPVTYTDAQRNDANVAILVYGDQLDQSASTEIGAIVEAANGSILAVSTWRWDAATATFTIDYTVNSAAGLSADESAWLTVNAMSAHWETGQPFRESGGVDQAGTAAPGQWLRVRVGLEPDDTGRRRRDLGCRVACRGRRGLTLTERSAPAR